MSTTVTALRDSGRELEVTRINNENGIVIYVAIFDKDGTILGNIVISEDDFAKIIDSES